MRSSLDYFNFPSYYFHSQNCVLNCSNNAWKINRNSSQRQVDYNYGVGLLAVLVDDGGYDCIFCEFHFRYQ